MLLSKSMDGKEQKIPYALNSAIGYPPACPLSVGVSQV